MAQEIALLVTLATTGTAAFYVAWPLVSGTSRRDEYLEADPSEALMDRLLYLEDRALAALEGLDLEREIGKLPVQEHERLRKRYRRRIGLLNKYIDGLEEGRYPSQTALDAVEGEVAEEMRDGLSEQGEAGYPREAEDPQERTPGRVAERKKGPRGISPSQRGGSVPLLCPACGHSDADPDATFCTRCGSPLLCASCGQPIAEAQAAFCSRCGARFQAGSVSRR